MECAGFTRSIDSHYVNTGDLQTGEFYHGATKPYYLISCVLNLHFLKNLLLKICTRRFFSVVKFSARILEILLAFCEFRRTNFEPWISLHLPCTQSLHCEHTIAFDDPTPCRQTAHGNAPESRRNNNSIIIVKLSYSYHVIQLTMVVWVYFAFFFRYRFF